MNCPLRKSTRRPTVDLRCTWVILGPDPEELVQVMGSQDGRVSGEIVEVVHDDSDEQVQHEEGAQEDEGDEVDVREVRPAHFVVEPARGLVDGKGQRVALAPGHAGQHDARPSFPSGASENDGSGWWVKKRMRQP